MGRDKYGREVRTNKNFYFQHRIFSNIFFYYDFNNPNNYCRQYAWNKIYRYYKTILSYVNIKYFDTRIFNIFYNKEGEIKW